MKLRAASCLIGLASLAEAAPRPITGGSNDLDHPSIVAITVEDRPICSGTLIAPTKVLTAAHCATDAISPDAIAVGEMAPFSDRVVIFGITRHARFDGLHSDADVAILELSRPPRGIVPVPLAKTPLVAGQRARIVGYGRASVVDAGERVRRQGTVTLTGVERGSYVTAADPSQACNGDSGGALLVEEDGHVALAGVISQAEQSCTGWGRVARVDVLADRFITPQISEALPVGARCFDDGACASGRCEVALDEPLARVCVSSCAADADCPAEMTCEASTCRATPSPGAQGSSCVTRFDCMIGLCASTGVCAQSCGSDVDCASGEACTPSLDGPLACAPAETASGGGCRTTRGGTWLVVALLWVLLAQRFALARR